MVYKWSISEIKEKQKYALQRLKSKTISKEEKERLELSLITYISVLNHSGTFYTRFYNFMDKLTKDQFSLLKDASYIEMEKKLVYDQMPTFSDEYLQFLLTLTTNLTQAEIEDTPEFLPLTLSNEELIQLSTHFYSQLNDPEINQYALKILNDPTAINITPTVRDGYQEFGGITYHDYIFNKSYCTIMKSDTISDTQALNHEVMHGIDFYMHHKIPSKNYYGFHEVPTYTIDYLFIDYLEQVGLDKNEVDNLRSQKKNYLVSLADLTLAELKGNLIRKKGFKASLNSDMQEINECLTPEIKKQLLEVQSGIMAYGLFQQILTDKKVGIDHLKQLMKQDIPKGQAPDFSNIGLSNNQLLSLSRELTLNHEEIVDNRKYK